MQISPMRTDENSPFAYHTMKERLPGLLLDLIERNQFEGEIRANLENLHYAMKNNHPLPSPDYLAPDAALWLEDFAAHQDETWLDSEWFFSEMLFFREVINRVKFWQTGKDPYKSFKTEELYGDGLKQQLKTALAFDGSPEENLRAMIHMALWGNRADLSLPEVVAQGQTVSDGDLLIDDSEIAARAMLNGQGIVHLITDNFGTELAMDLALVYHVLKEAIPVALHVKMNPTYVSDATATDIRWMLHALPEISPDFVAIASSLQAALDSGQLRVYPDFFWNSSRYYDHLPNYLLTALSQARVIISKGDANYRRALYDTIWSVETAFTEIVHAIPAPLLALRTLKSDPIVGLTQEKANRLDMEDAHWRTNGKRGIIQFAP